MEEQNINNIQEQEEGFSMDDFIKICKRFWEKRKYIIKVGCIFVALGFIAALTQKPIYNSSCVFVPQSQSKSSSSSLSSLAALAGVNLGDMSSSASLSPLIYPKLLSSVDFNKELMQTKLHFKEFDEPISLLDYYTNPDYQKFSLFGTIAKYTIGLPGVIMKAIRGEKPEVSAPSSDNGKQISKYTKKEYEVAKKLGAMVSVAVEKKDGYLTLSTTMGEAIPCAELCQATFDLLGKYITEFKIEAAQANNDYIRSRYDEVKADYEEKQLALAKFTDANRGDLTATAQIKRDQLLADYNMANAMYSEMAKQLLQSDMKVKEDTPVLSAVQPVSVPMKKANSRSMTLIVWCFFGAIVAFGTVLGFDFLKKKGIAWPKNWE